MMKYIKPGDAITVIAILTMILISTVFTPISEEQSGTGILALVERDGILIDTFLLDRIELSSVHTYRTLDDKHFNTVLVEPGRICVVSTDCPAQVDVSCGWLSMPGQSAICLPHRFIVYLVAKGNAMSDWDAIAK